MSPHRDRLPRRAAWRSRSTQTQIAAIILAVAIFAAAVPTQAANDPQPSPLFIESLESTVAKLDPDSESAVPEQEPTAVLLANRTAEKSPTPVPDNPDHSP